MLAMDSKTPWGFKRPALSLTTIASMLAPTKSCVTGFAHQHLLAHHVIHPVVNVGVRQEKQ